MSGILLTLLSLALGGGTVALVTYVMTYRENQRSQYLGRLEELYKTLYQARNLFADFAELFGSLDAFLTLDNVSDDRKRKDFFAKFGSSIASLDEAVDAADEKLIHALMLVNFYFPSLMSFTTAISDLGHDLNGIAKGWETYKVERGALEIESYLKEVKKHLDCFKKLGEKGHATMEQTLSLVRKHAREEASKKPWPRLPRRGSSA